MKSWKARLLTGLMLVATLLIMVAGPAMARDNNCNDRCDDRHDDNCCNHNFFDRHDVDDIDFIGFSPFIGFTPFVSVIDDLDIERVGNNNSLEGDCVPTDLDFDDFIAEWEVTCFV